MGLYALIWPTGLSFLFFVAVFRPLEVFFPAKPGQRFFRPAWLTDLAFFLGSYFLWGGLVLWILSHFNSWLNDVVSLTFRDAVASQPWWLQAIEVVVLSDFLTY